MHTEQVTGEFPSAPSSATALAHTAQRVDSDGGALGFLGGIMEEAKIHEKLRNAGRGDPELAPYVQTTSTHLAYQLKP